MPETERNSRRFRAHPRTTEPPLTQGFRNDGARGTRTPDLLGAIQALSQLSYSPGWIADCSRRRIQRWWTPCGPIPARGYAAAREMSDRGLIGDLRDRLSSFRTRLRLFFVLIVIVPMVAVTFIVFRLIGESENGQADARVAARQEAAIGLYYDARASADRLAARIGRDPELSRALRSGDRTPDPGRARRLLATTDAKRIAISHDGAVWADVGDPPRLPGHAQPGRQRHAGRRPPGLGARARAGLRAPRHSHDPDGDDRAPQRPGNRVDASPPRHRQAAASTRARSRSAAVASAPPRSPPRASSASASRSRSWSRGRRTEHDIRQGRLVAGSCSLGFFLLALVSAIVVSRSLTARSRSSSPPRGAWAAATSRRGAIRGRDQFAQLGEEFNKMSRAARGPPGGARAGALRMELSLRRIGETFASSLDRDGLLEIMVRTAVDAVDAEGGRALMQDCPGGERDAGRERRDTTRASRAADEAERARRRDRRAVVRQRRRRPCAGASLARRAGRGRRRRRDRRPHLGLARRAPVLPPRARAVPLPRRPGRRVGGERRPPRDRRAPGGHRRADRPLQPPPLPGDDVGRGRALQALRPGARPGDARHRRLQGRQRQLRPSAGRHRPARGRQDPAGVLARDRRARALRRRGARGDRCPGTDLQGAHKLAERVREGIEALRLPIIGDDGRRAAAGDRQLRRRGAARSRPATSAGWSPRPTRRSTRPSAPARTARSAPADPADGRAAHPSPSRSRARYAKATMGLLDDAIREHLDLKRRRGADPSEIAKEEADALGPVRRDGADEELVDDAAPAEHGSSRPDRGRRAGVAYDDDAAGVRRRAAGVRRTPRASPSPPSRRPPTSARTPSPRRRARRRPTAIRSPTSPRASSPRRARRGARGTSERRARPSPRPASPTPPAGDEEDVLEETPDFLQETPEHDRLWFEQKPPKDFDF